MKNMMEPVNSVRVPLFSEPEEPDNDDQPLGGTVLARLQASGCHKHQH